MLNGWPQIRFSCYPSELPSSYNLYGQSWFTYCMSKIVELHQISLIEFKLLLLWKCKKRWHRNKYYLFDNCNEVKLIVLFFNVKLCNIIFVLGNRTDQTVKCSMSSSNLDRLWNQAMSTYMKYMLPMGFLAVTLHLAAADFGSNSLWQTYLKDNSWMSIYTLVSQGERA